jgi:hypothetical protein
MGYTEPKDYEVMTDLVMKYIARETDKRPSVADMMTNRFAGIIALTPAEWEQTQKIPLPVVAIRGSTPAKVPNVEMRRERC